MRFEVSRVLDTIQTRLTLDPALARGVLDLAEVTRLVDLEGDTGKPASVLRLGHVIDALGRYLGEDGAYVFAVLPRALLSDLDLTSNEKMVVRRWADDGLVEVLPEPADRVLEVAELLGVPVLSRRAYQEFADRYPWLPQGVLAPTRDGLSALGGGAAAPGVAPPPSGAAVLSRLWRCPEPDCPGFGAPGAAQPPPRLTASVPTCPRHGGRLADAGSRPAARALAVQVDGVVRRRFVVREGAPVVVGRAPGEGLELGAWLSEPALRWISRSHLRLELRDGALVVTDTSTNGTKVRTAGGALSLASGEPRRLGGDDVVELYHQVFVGRPELLRSGAAQPESVMADAPTVALRLPRS